MSINEYKANQPAKHIVRLGRVKTLEQVRDEFVSELESEFNDGNTPALVRHYLDATRNPERYVVDDCSVFVNAALNDLFPQDGDNDECEFADRIIKHFYVVLDDLRVELADKGYIEWSRY